MIEQRSEEWYERRCGKITASRVADLMARTKSGYSTSRQNYIAQCAIERLTGKCVESFKNKYMERGIELEPEAIGAYEADRMVSVEPAEFKVHPTMCFLGASPDGRVCDGLVEVKCRNATAHFDYLRKKKIERATIIQMHVQMMCYEVSWCDFVAYHPDFPEHLRLWVQRVELDKNLVDEITTEVVSAEKEILKMMKL
jgi:putative phage-type endonuclease